MPNAIEVAAPPKGQLVRWILALDGTPIQRGAFTKIEGGIQTDRKAGKSKPRRKKNTPRRRTDCKASKKKGRKTKYHTMLLGILTTHDGVRIPLPRYTCDPKNFKRRGSRKKVRDTQMDLAKLMINRALNLLPAEVHLVVVADSYFECENLVALARRRSFTLIVPTDSNRCFADKESPSKSNGHRIRDRGLRLHWKHFSRLDLRRGSEGTASFRRHSRRKQGPKDRRTHWYRHESRTVAKLGTVGIAYSWKTPVYEPRKTFGKASFKILLCSDPEWTGEEIIEYFEIRWTAIEIVIRELKGELGFDHYTGQSLYALERYLDVVLLSFLYLEMHRQELLQDPKTDPEVAQQAQAARTQGMRAIVKWEANQQLLRAVKRSYRSERTRRLANRYLSHLAMASATEPDIAPLGASS
ncbi:MAG: hypothetical protein HY815_26105 [Candidatus Riflebacteria bacterium]|nr:hypothetical protein [Candidatus Riflebacteria bacterium]